MCALHKVYKMSAKWGEYVCLSTARFVSEATWKIRIKFKISFCFIQIKYKPHFTWMWFQTS